ncbi:MAG: tRNA 2-thiouridine(34) synthase MnmA, partial [Deltaproteobacteria bacterium]|nr:tRNA 2-thiouridine(34) synthase MnmA [Deltaproteobacteria bacterium]
FLYGVAPDALSRTLLPLSDLTKPEVRALAAEAGLPVADKPESQDVCFLAGEPYWAWLARQGFLTDPDPGDVTDRDGRVLGRHQGVHRFTVGQRRGFGRSYGGRTYVVAIDAGPKRVVVGGRDDLTSAEVRVEECRWQGGLTPDRPFEAQVLVRYRDRGRPGRVTPCAGGTARVETAEPVSAVTPGQAAVFYVDDVVAGGGTIS